MSLRITEFLIFSAILMTSCQTAKDGAGLRDFTDTKICRVADPSTIDAYLMQHAKDALNKTGSQEIWTLMADTDGLVTYTELYDVLKSGGSGTFNYRKEGPTITTLEKSVTLAAEQLQVFQEKITKADQLCDLSNPSFGGTKFFYLHLAPDPDGELKAFGAFVAPNPDGTAAGNEYADIVKIFTDFAATVAP